MKRGFGGVRERRESDKVKRERERERTTELVFIVCFFRMRLFFL